MGEIMLWPTWFGIRQATSRNGMQSTTQQLRTNNMIHDLVNRQILSDTHGECTSFPKMGMLHAPGTLQPSLPHPPCPATSCPTLRNRSLRLPRMFFNLLWRTFEMDQKGRGRPLSWNAAKRPCRPAPKSRKPPHTNM